ncbi:BRO-N domain-containing protein [Spartinivicinus ruber]|uniref:BRO-N domain-containing protein n=1 Tax=Spartinivicinus ruber TaxID=2683272 RepID=UPI0013D162E9|nr:Bro-N domain-containing protein [Spartinivicinus ruber]
MEIITIKYPVIGSLKVIKEADKLWFDAKDVAERLGYQRPLAAVEYHCKWVLKRDLSTSSGIRELVVISEQDFYRLIYHSRLSKAKRLGKSILNTISLL